MQNNQNQDFNRKDASTNNVRGMGDSDLQNRIMSAINSDTSIDASNITIRMRENNMIELCGTVPEQSMIERATECVRKVDGVKGEIDNDLKVRSN